MLPSSLPHSLKCLWLKHSNSRISKSPLRSQKHEEPQGESPSCTHTSVPSPAGDRRALWELEAAFASWSKEKDMLRIVTLHHLGTGVPWVNDSFFLALSVPIVQWGWAPRWELRIQWVATYCTRSRGTVQGEMTVIVPTLPRTEQWILSWKTASFVLTWFSPHIPIVISNMCLQHSRYLVNICWIN